MAYGIMRVEKRGRSAVYGLQIEANRSRDDHDLYGRDFDRSDIDWKMTDNNVHLVCNMDGWNKEITRQIKDAGCRERKDSIVLLDGLYTASPEWFDVHSQEEWMSYFEDCLAYHVQEYCQGNLERVINAVIHVDESTPHMQVASVPICEDEKGYHLSAKIIMGNRTDYQRRQDRFWEQVARSRGLDRGETDTGRKHHELTQQYKLAKREKELAQVQERTAQEKAKTAAIIARRQASIDQANQQKLTALRERDAARADRDVAVALSELRDAVSAPSVPVVEVQEVLPAKKSIWGKETPERVVIDRVDLDRVQQAADNANRAAKTVREMDRLYAGMVVAAKDANENRIDKQAAADKAAVSAERQRAEQMEHELRQARVLLRLAQEKAADIEARLEQMQAQQQEVQKVLDYYPGKWEEMVDRTRKAREMERAYQNRYANSYGAAYVPYNGRDVPIRQFLRQYLAECDMQHIRCKPELHDHLAHLLDYDRGMSPSRSRR